jgi:predicted enzyme related to lactoylglutathione lyase
MLTVGGRPIGGIMEMAEDARKMGAPPHWLAYVSVDDLDEYTEKAAELGAKVYVSKVDVPEVGEFSILGDPAGAVFAMFQSAGDDPEQPDMETPGAFSWHELMTDDFDGAWDFYTELFGWQQTDSMDMGEMGEYRMFGVADETTYGGIMQKPDDFPMSAWVLYITVDDIDDAIKRAESHGGKKLNGPQEVPGGGKTAQFLDDQGGMFAFYAPA